MRVCLCLCVYVWIKIVWCVDGIMCGAVCVDQKVCVA